MIISALGAMTSKFHPQKRVFWGVKRAFLDVNWTFFDDFWPHFGALPVKTSGKNHFF